MIQKYMVPRAQSPLPSLALLALRLVAGTAFLIHGLPKIQHPFSWMGNSSMPAVLVAAAAVAEFFGGAAWIAGLLTPIFSLLIAATMSVATYTHISRGDPFVGREGSYELALVYGCISLVFLFCGPGSFSLDSMLFGKAKK